MVSHFHCNSAIACLRPGSRIKLRLNADFEGSKGGRTKPQNSDVKIDIALSFKFFTHKNDELFFGSLFSE